MHDPSDNPEIAAASQDRGGATGQVGCVVVVQYLPATPRAATGRGVSVCEGRILDAAAGIAMTRGPHARGRDIPAGPPPAITRAARHTRRATPR